MQNLIPKLRQTSIISKKPGFLPEKLKILTSSNYHLELLLSLKNEFVKTGSFLIFANN